MITVKQFLTQIVLEHDNTDLGNITTINQEPIKNTNDIAIEIKSYTDGECHTEYEIMPITNVIKTFGKCKLQAITLLDKPEIGESEFRLVIDDAALN